MMLRAIEVQSSLLAEPDEVTGAGAPAIVASAPRLAGKLASLLSIGVSGHGALFDRQCLGVVKDHVVLGPPGRPEYNQVSALRLPVINLGACAYLGLGTDLRVRRAAVDALERYGTRAGGARPLAGTTPAHFDLELKLAGFLRAPAVATFSAGYLANISAMVSLFGPGDLIILDRHAHRSLYDGARLSGAELRRFRHNDVRHLERILRTTSSIRRRLVAVDGVYSMEGHVAPLDELVPLARAHGAFLMVDEAHAFGVLGANGRGAVEHHGVDPCRVDIRTGSLNKALPAAGGFVAADAAVILLLRYTSPGMTFSGALGAASALAAHAALDILEAEPQRVRGLQCNAEHFRRALESRGLDTMGSETPIVPVLIGDQERTLAVASALLERGVYVNAIIAPGVQRGRERLRCFVTADHCEADLDHAADTIAEVVNSHT
jgi:glycine C-acetyltransferase